MIRRYASALRLLLMVTDACVALAVTAVVSQLRFGSDWQQALNLTFRPTWVPILAYAVLWVGVLYHEGEYRLRARWTLRTEVAGISRGAAWMALLTFTALFLSDMKEVSRLFLLVLFPVQAAATIATRGVLRWWLARIRRAGKNVRNVLILGTGRQALAFSAQLAEHSALGLRIIGFLGDEADSLADPRSYLGPIASFEQVLHSQVVDEVAICLPGADWSWIQSIAHLCQEEGKIVRIPLEVPDVGPGMRFVEDLDGTTVLSLVKAPDRVLTLAVKRIIDVVGAIIGLILFSPLLLATAIYIRLQDGSPVIFRQERVGTNGRRFAMYKFRTMVKNAEERYEAVSALSDTRGAAFKMTDDPRVTPWGRKLRRTSVDELPQLWNVLKGEMSLVGPRPAPPREVAAYSLWQRRRLSMKPGLTGLWQISSRVDAEFDDRAKLDLDYIDRWSLLLDLRIVVLTVPALLKVNGH